MHYLGPGKADLKDSGYAPDWIELDPGYAPDAIRGKLERARAALARRWEWRPP